MRIAFWNCRSLGNGPAVRGFLNLQKQVDPDILFLSETKLEENRMKWFKSTLGFHNMVVKRSEGKSGRLVIFWKGHINASLRNYSKYHIDVEVKEEDGFK